MSGLSALLSIRESFIQQQLPTWSADKSQIIIGTQSFPRHTLTPYRVKNKNEYYPLDALAFLLEADTNKLKVAQYLQEATKQGIMPVSSVQKPQLLSYLRGEVSDTPDLDLPGLARLEAERGIGGAAPGAAGAVKSEGAASERKEEVGVEESAAKRQRIDQAKPVSEWRVEDIVAEECPLTTHLSAMQVPRKNFTSLLELYHKAAGDSKHKQEGSGRDRDRDSKSRVKHEKGSSRAPAPLLNPRDPNYGVPIIVVPAALSSVINLFNVQQLLENGVFVSGEKLRAEGMAKPPTPLTVSRSSFYDATKSVKYHVLDDVTTLKDGDWERVVAVFVSGAAWQFSDWPKKRWANPAAIFENVCAFHLHFDDEQLHPNILQWRTHRLPLSKTKRHGDRSVVLDFWHILNEFIAARNATKKLNI